MSSDEERENAAVLSKMAERLAAIETDLRLIRTHGLPTCPAHGYMIEDHITRLKALDDSTDKLHDLMLRLEGVADANQRRIGTLEVKVAKLEAAEGKRGVIVLSLSAIGTGIGIGVGFVIKYLLHHGGKVSP